MNNNENKPTLYATPFSRSEIVVWALEELGCPYNLEVIDFKLAAQQNPEHLARNPMGKVPVLKHRGQFISETSAICCYLADCFPAAGLAPTIEDVLRGPYLRWLFFAPSCIEPAFFLSFPEGSEPLPESAGWGDKQRVVNVLTDALQQGPWLLGDKFSMADLIVGSQLFFALGNRMVEKLPVFSDYCRKLQQRPAFKRKIEIEKKQAKKIGGVPWAPYPECRPGAQPAD